MQKFFCDYCEIFKNTFFGKYLQAVASAVTKTVQFQFSISSVYFANTNIYIYKNTNYKFKLIKYVCSYLVENWKMFCQRGPLNKSINLDVKQRKNVKELMPQRQLFICSSYKILVFLFSLRKLIVIDVVLVLLLSTLNIFLTFFLLFL